MRNVAGRQYVLRQYPHGDSVQCLDGNWQEFGKEIGASQGCHDADRGDWLQAEGPLVFDLNVFDWMEPMPKREAAGYDKSDENADEKEQTISGQGDEENGDDGNGRDQSGGTLQAETETGPGHIEIILAPGWRVV